MISSLRIQSISSRLLRSSCSRPNSTHFGFETVEEEEKSDKVYEVFKNVATKYDLMNDAMSLGVHRLWKDEFVWRLKPSLNMKLVDVAGGTGDIAFRFLKCVHYERQKRRISTPMAASVTVSDINDNMLAVGKERAEQLGYTEGISWQQADAEKLPFDDNQFDAYTIAFGIRNCTHVDKVVKEAHRVLKPGGKYFCLEFSKVNSPILRSLYDLYSFQVIPPMGQVLAGDWKSYQYLVESIRQFPSQEDYSQMIKEAGFNQVSYENMSFGVVAIHSGVKPL